MIVMGIVCVHFVPLDNLGFCSVIGKSEIAPTLSGKSGDLMSGISRSGSPGLKQIQFR
jgi:hypothetical protein